MIQNIFLLSHQDDEMGVFNHIEKIIKDNQNITIFYLTNGSIKKRIDPNLIFRRDFESLKVLYNLGVKKDNIIFLGRKLEVNVYELHENLEKTYDYIINFIRNIDGKINIYTHSNEGGNIDHDSCFYLAKKIMNNLDNIENSYQFSLYNSYKMPLFLYRVMSPLKENGKIIKSQLNFSQKIKYCRLLFNYVSQLHIWLGLFPIIIFKILMNQYGSIQIIDSTLIVKKPHDGLLWYEKRKFISFSEYKKIIEVFLSK